MFLASAVSLGRLIFSFLLPSSIWRNKNKLSCWFMVSVCLSSYGCTQEVAKNKRSEQLTLASQVLINFPNTFITQLTHMLNYESMIVLFYGINIISSNLVSPNILKAYRHFNGFIASSMCFHNIMEYADDKQRDHFTVACLVAWPWN